MLSYRERGGAREGERERERERERDDYWISGENGMYK